MSKVKIRLFTRKYMDELNISVDGGSSYGFSPAPEVDLKDFIEWLMQQLEMENIIVINDREN